jgi:hypothetical protein
VSLILEALKKLEREKQTPPDRGFLVVAHVPWPAGTRSRSLWLGGVGALAAAGLLALVLNRGREGRPAAVTPPVATTPTARATPEASREPEASRAPAVSLPQADTTPATTLALPALPPPAPGPLSPLVTPATRAKAPTPSPSPAGESDLRLNAITRQEGRPVAVLNDRLVREGDVFDGIHVIRIGEAEVEVEVNGKRRIVRF